MVAAPLGDPEFLINIQQDDNKRTAGLHRAPSGRREVIRPVDRKFEEREEHGVIRAVRFPARPRGVQK